MSRLSDALRLQTAQFNTFLIENYLGKLKTQENEGEPHAYLFNSFFKLSEHLAKVGSLLGDLTNLQPGSLIPVNDAIKEAVNMVFLIEKAAGIDELALNIRGINTASFQSNIKNILAYGREFGKDQQEINTELDELKQDNREYFNEDGTLKFASYEIKFEEAIQYLIDHSSVLQVKNTVKKIADTYQFFSSITTATDNRHTNYAGDKIFLIHLMNALTIQLMALGYIEPFFLKLSNTTQLFEQYIKGILDTQSSVLNDFS
jgi:hypothetical protein